MIPAKRHQLTTRIQQAWLRLLIWGAMLTGLSYVAKPFAYQTFTPDIRPHALQAYSWKTLESIPLGIVGDIEVGLDGSLWIGARDAVIYYDGQNFVTYRKGEGLPTTGYFQYHVTINAKGEPFAMSNKQVFKLSAGVWQAFGPEITPAPRQNWWSQSFLTSKGEEVWAASGPNLLRVNAHSFEYIGLGRQDIESFVIDASGYFWVLFNGSKTVVRYVNRGGEFVALNQWPNLMGGQSPAKLSLLANNSIWLTNEDPQQAPKWLALDSDSASVWQQEAYADVNSRSNTSANGNNYTDQLVVSSQDGQIILFNDSHINIKYQGKWQAQALSTLGLDGKQLGALKSDQGVVWLLETSKSISRLDLANPQQTTYNDLILACSSDDKQVFIHRVGDIVIHATKQGQWYRYGQAHGLISTPTNALCTRNNDLVVYGSENKQAAFSFISLTDNSNSLEASSAWQSHLLPELGENIGPLSALEASSGKIYFGANAEGVVEPGVLMELSRVADGFAKRAIPLSQGRVAGISEPQAGSIVLSSFDLNELKKDQLTPLLLPENVLSIWIDSIASDADSALWVSTWYYGVLRFNGASWRQYSLNEGLSGENIAHVLPMSNRQVLALSNGGVDWFDGSGWQASNIHGVRALREGSHLVEGIDGAVWVNQYSREWAFRFQINNKNRDFPFSTTRYRGSKHKPIVEIKLDQRTELGGESVHVSWRAYDRWFDTPSNKLKYSFRVNRSEWSEFSYITSRFFTHLTADTYTIDVRARDGDGNISLPASLSFTIASKFWQTTWFLTTLAVVFVLLLLTLAVLIVQRIKQTARIHQSRMRFLTNISHDLRNPLALIISPLEERLQKDTQADADQLKLTSSNAGLALALRNAQRLKKLVDELLEYRQLKAGALNLNPQHGDLLIILKLIVNDLNYLASKKDQTITLTENLGQYYCDFDADVFRKIIDNLISNALKYSDRATHICVDVERLAQQGLCISIEDEGFGIDPQHQPHVFDPFYTQRKASISNTNSFGIGLALVKDLIELCSGNIQLQSPPLGKTRGTRFVLNFPSLIENKVSEHPIAQPSVKAEQSVGAGPQQLQHSFAERVGADEAAHVLIVDDNIELAEYLAQELANTFTCHVTYDGESALEYALTEIPDVIISDYKMPHMDGLQLCEALKKKTETSHIPVLLHTAMVSKANELKGLAFGAVDYIHKPASIPLIKNKLKNVLKNRRLYADFIKRNIGANAVPEKSESSGTIALAAEEPRFDGDMDQAFSFAGLGKLSDREKKFLDNIKEILLKHYQSAEFNAEKMAAELHMSRSAFYRKFKALTNITPAEYIKIYRLQAARALLSKGSTVADTLKAVGFNDSSSFSRAYKAHFSCTPSEHRKH